MELTFEQTEAYTPLFAYIDQKSGPERDFIFRKFSLLDEDSVKALTDPETAEKIADLVTDGAIPPTHGKAVALMVALVMFGEVNTDQLEPVLQKLGLTPDQATRTAAAVREIASPALNARVRAEAPKMTQMPPMTRPMENGPKPLVTGPGVPDRNIIDLRKTT